MHKQYNIALIDCLVFIYVKKGNMASSFDSSYALKVTFFSCKEYTHEILNYALI